ncbi:MAG: SAM-dependent methyltransferase [Acidobacteria bacterium]|nr:MAG: SAM-dependent methyltransferase [Acidobacteriota bacterium]REK02727.1 MAG: SAM-dependent methyltransferase [Acidobacteriota bacterium]REK13468.1 MAG: SAM-dependent methyltransferase [Acidobacteriota bacterium]REK41462.1 MAG: SAM-dependent methyltransferase [Acidobacteriota bacterium]
MNSGRSAESSVSASFRDPDGRVIVSGDRVFRFVYPRGQESLSRFLNSELFSALSDSGEVIGTRHADKDVGREIADRHSIKGFASVLEHDAVPFASFAYEWCPEMLASAARLTLKLAESAAESQWGLKDATPYNILFRGTRPVFIDLLSFEEREPLDPVWKPNAQFIRTFLLPLQLAKYIRLPFRPFFLLGRDGIEPETAYEVSGWFARWLTPLRTTATLPALLSKKSEDGSIYNPRTSKSPEQAAFVFARILRGLRKKLDSASPQAQRGSVWSGYMDQNLSVEPGYVDQKKDLVREFVASHSPRTVLDIGCNTGEFSKIAARSGSRTVSIDTDEVVIDELFRSADNESLDILPLVIDISRPSPAVGWMNSENPSFIARAAGRFEAVLMLAVVHHLLVTERIPLEEVVDLIASIDTRALLIEWVSPDDPMFRTIARGRDELHRDLTEDVFREAFEHRFRTRKRTPLVRETRVMYEFVKK